MVACAVLASFSAQPAGRASGTVAVYTDDDSVTVVSPTAQTGMGVGPVELSVSAGVDIVSAASVDIVSAGSPRGFDEVRAHAQLGGRWAYKRGAGLSAGYALSFEPDFLSHALTLGLTQDVFDAAATLAVSYAFGWSDVGRVADPEFHAQRNSHQIELGWSHVLSATAVLDLAYGLTLVNGYQANPYRFVWLHHTDGGPHETAVAERTPDVRVRQLGTLRLRKRLVPDVFAAAEYQLFGDSWGMLAHTGTLRGSVSLGGSQWTVAGEVRANQQTGVRFYRRRYQTLPDQAPALRTADKALGPMWTVRGGLHLDWTPPVGWADRFRIGLGADVLHLRYLDHPLIQQRTAVIGILDLSWEN